MNHSKVAEQQETCLHPEFKSRFIYDSSTTHHCSFNQLSTYNCLESASTATNAKSHSLYLIAMHMSPYAIT